MHRTWLVVVAGLLALSGCDGGGDGGGDASTDGPMVMFRDSGLSGAQAFVEWRMRCNAGDCPAMDPPARVGGWPGMPVMPMSPPMPCAIVL